jgi:acyl-CoA synthetase (AMP-forming)/AMP-acid ligase II
MTSAAIDSKADLPLTIPALMRRNVRERGDQILLACDNTRLSYAEADARSRHLARALLAAGATKGSHVALLCPASSDFVVVMLAVTRIGAVFVPLSTLSTADELRWLLANSDSNFLISAQSFRSQRYTDILQAAIPELDYRRPPPLHSSATPWLRRIWFLGELPAGWDAGWSFSALEAMAPGIQSNYLDAVEDRVLPSDRFAILHTSGSTGQPKGVMHQQGSALKHLYNVNAARRLKADDVYFTTFAWFWTAGFAFGLIAVIAAGARMVWSNATVASEILDLIERERVTFTSGFWRSVARLAEDPSFAQRDLSSVRRGNLWPILAPQARPSDPALRHDIYGMSETGPGVSLDQDEIDVSEEMRGSCGRFMPEFEVKIVDPETLKTLGPNEPGELWVRGPLMAEGYYGKPRSAIYLPDGWYRTNDIGVIDDNGYFFLRGRRGDMIKTAGANVAPREVEAVLSPLVANRPTIVLGIPDEERGQLVVAVVVTEVPVEEAVLRRKVAEKLSSYKVPRQILSMTSPEIPLLANGKYDMPRLTALVRERIMQSVTG